MGNTDEKIEWLRFLAKVQSWREVSFSEKDRLMVFRRKGVRLNLWYVPMTVGTILNHPRLGKTQMIRKRVDMKMMEQIFVNPRLHTNIGYIKKKPTNRNRWDV